MLTKHKQSGFTLIESLVSMLIIVFGLLGTAALQSVAVSGTKVAADRSMAAVHTSALISRVKGNDAFWQAIPPGFDISISATGAIADIGAGLDGAALEAESTDCAASICNGVQLASYNLKIWAQDGSSISGSGGMADRFSAPAARIRRIGVDFPVMLEFAISWGEIRAASGLTMANTYYTGTGTAANATRNFTFTLRARP